MGENEKPSCWMYFAFVLLGIVIGTLVFPARNGFSIVSNNEVSDNHDDSSSDKKSK